MKSIISVKTLKGKKMTKETKVELATSTSIMAYAITGFQTLTSFLYWEYDWQDFRFHIMGLALISVKYIIIWKAKR